MSLSRLDVGPEEAAAVAEVLDSGRLTMGPKAPLAAPSSGRARFARASV